MVPINYCVIYTFAGASHSIPLSHTVDNTASLIAFRWVFGGYILQFFALQKEKKKEGGRGEEEEKNQPHSSVSYTPLLPSSLNQHIKQTLKTGFLLQSSAQD